MANDGRNLRVAPRGRPEESLEAPCRAGDEDATMRVGVYHVEMESVACAMLSGKIFHANAKQTGLGWMGRNPHHAGAAVASR